MGRPQHGSEVLAFGSDLRVPITSARSTAAGLAIRRRPCQHAPVATQRHIWTWCEKASAERGRRGWSVAELARRAKLQPSTLRRWLRGKHAPREGVVARVARAFGWPANYLTDPDAPYEPTMDRETAAKIVAGLTPNALRVVFALSDPRAVAYLVRAVDQYEELRKNLER